MIISTISNDFIFSIRFRSRLVIEDLCKLESSSSAMAASAMHQLAFGALEHQHQAALVLHHPSASSSATGLDVFSAFTDSYSHSHPHKALKTSLMQMPTHYPVGNMPPAQAARQFANTAARLADAAKMDASIIKSLLMQAQMHLAKLLQIKSQTDAAAEGSQLASKAAVAKNMGFSTAAVGVTSGSEFAYLPGFSYAYDL